MCYYNGVRVSKEEFIRLKSLERELKHLQRLNRPIQSGFEYGNSLILLPSTDKQSFEIEDAHWEFIPPWCSNWQAVHESRKKFTTLNAIGENLFESRLYKDAALKRRCLVLSSGFYEWRHFKPEGAKKALTYPYFIDVAQEQSYFFMAGIYQPWTDKETGETINTFAIVTTKANDLMEQVHNVKKRMPLILTEDLAYEWLLGNLTPQRITEIANFQFDSEDMTAHTVAKDFRTALDPTEVFEYEELPPLL